MKESQILLDFLLTRNTTKLPNELFNIMVDLNEGEVLTQETIKSFKEKVVKYFSENISKKDVNKILLKYIDETEFSPEDEIYKLAMKFEIISDEELLELYVRLENYFKSLPENNYL